MREGESRSLSRDFGRIMKCSDGQMDLVVFKNAVVDSILLLCSH